MTARVGIVVVSHSAALAEAVVELAEQMVADDPPPISVAGGSDDGGFGTDAMAVLAAIESVASERGVLVVMDLGSALLSAEMALEFLGDVDYPVRLTSAPLVEGVVAAVVQAGLGSDLVTVAHEAVNALEAKRRQVGDDPAAGSPVKASTTGGTPDAVVEVTLVNEHGLHARPAAAFVQAAARYDAAVSVTNLTTGAGPGEAHSLSAIAGLGAESGHVLRIEATGADATAAVDALGTMVTDRFGEAGPGHADPGDTESHEASSDPEDAGRPTTHSTTLGLAPGRAVGRVVRMSAVVPSADGRPDVAPEGRDDAVASLRSASEYVAAVLERQANEVDDGEVRAVLNATASLARDPAIVEVAAARVHDDGVDPAVAVTAAAGDVAAVFTARGGLVAGRRRDVEDVRDRIVARLVDEPMPAVPVRDAPFVLLADDPSPVDTAALADSNCVALVVRRGRPDTHTAIVARALGLPTVVVGDRVDVVRSGDLVIVDGTRSTLVTDPSDEQVAGARQG